jgi:hypothetical protein
MTSLRHHRAVRVLALAALAVLASEASATAGKNSYTVRTTPAGQAAARAVVLRASDVGSGWKGGPVKPDLSVDPPCANFHPRYSDLVVTGAAATHYLQPGLAVRSDVAILRTPKMVALDWRRTYGTARYIACARTNLRKLQSKTTHVVALRRLSFPHIATYSSAYRATLDVKTKAGTVPVAVDILAFGSGRTEVVMTTTMPLASVPTLAQNELVLARMLASRIRV